MSGMDVLRERIARALWDKAQRKQPEGRLARSWDEAPIPSREELIAYADAVIAVLGLVEDRGVTLGRVRETQRRYVTPWERIEGDA